MVGVCGLWSRRPTNPGVKRTMMAMPTQNATASNTPGKHPREEHGPHRLLGDHCVNDQHHTGRNDHAQHRAAGDHADGEALAVLVADHFRNRNLGKHRSRSNRRAR